MTSPRKTRQYWLDDPANVTRLYRGLLGVCLGLVVIDLFFRKVAHFGWERWVGFYAVYGFLAYAAVVFIGGKLRKVVGRREDYYDR